MRCPVEEFAPVPAGLPMPDSAGTPIDALTAHQGLTDVLSLGRGEFAHKLGASVVVDHTQTDWPDQVRTETGGGATRVLACARPTLPGAARAARDGAVIATPVYADDYPDGERVHWQRYNGQPSGSRLIRMAPWFDDGSLSVHIARRYYLADAAAAHREVELGHTRGKLLLIVDDDLARKWEV